MKKGSRNIFSNKKSKVGTQITITSGGGGGSATVQNSDTSYSTTVPAGNTLILPDTTYNILVNGILNQTVDLITLKNDTLNITAI